jgi:hypothetical protein
MKLQKFFGLLSILLLLAVTPCYADFTASLNFYSDDFDTVIVMGEDSVYYCSVKCNLTNQISANDDGSPGLPVLSYVYSLPQGEEVSGITITSTSSQVLYGNLSNLVYPSQTDMITAIGEPQPDFVPPNSVYSDTVYPVYSQTVTCDDPIEITFGMGIATIKVFPVKYRIQQDQLVLYTNIQFTINTQATARTANVVNYRSTFSQKVVTDYLKGMVKNYSAVDNNLPLPTLSDYNYPTDPGDIPPEMVVITSSQIDGLTWFKNWKTNLKGMPTQIYTVENDIYPNYSGVDNAEKVRNFIKDKDAAGALYVLLVGNMDYVPVRIVWNDFVSDLYYACLEGTWDADNDGIWAENSDNPDLGPDILVGRVAASADPSDVANWTDKLVRYVDNPGYGDNWYLANVMIGSSDQMADSDQPQRIAAAFTDANSFFNVDTETFREKPNGHDLNPYFPYGQDYIDSLSYPSYGYYVNLNHGSPHDYAVLTAGINGTPASVVTSFDGAQGGPMRNGYIGDVENEGREYVHSSISCYVGALNSNYWTPYAYPDCFAEKSLILNGGCVAGTFNTDVGWVYSSYLIEINRIGLLCNSDSHHRLSEAHYGAKAAFIGSNRLLILNNTFFGDPSMIVWTEEPGRLAVTHPSTAYRDLEQSFQLNVKDSSTNIGIGDILVTLSKGDEVFGRGLTNAGGNVSITIKPDTEGMLTITANRFNFKPYVDSIFVDTYCEPAVAGDANGNGVCNGLDITFLQAYFQGGGAAPPDTCMCGNVMICHAADANGSCTLNGLDVTYLVAYFKGGSAPHICANCPSSRLLESNEQLMKTEEMAR